MPEPSRRGAAGRPGTTAGQPNESTDRVAAAAQPPKPRRRRPPRGGVAGEGRQLDRPPLVELRTLPELHLPEALPVSARRDEIVAAIAANPVVIVSGETGSGKTTQLPKMCWLAGGGRAGLIGHTQPRRLAATMVARRIAEELNSPLGEYVGYKIRFNERLEAGAPIKLMTDGILLAETQHDRLLRQYDTLIIDEAHERSVNIDFLLGYLKQLVEGPRRHDLKIVITSATIDAQRFARHFALDARDAPVIEVSGRMYPVEVRYRDPLEAAASDADDDDETDLPAMIEQAVDELWREGPGDVLVFLPGEREIHEVADHLRRAHARQAASAGRGGAIGGAAIGRAAIGRGAIEVLPLYARLSAAEQDRVFSPSQGRRIVLATNVAETSLTVPGIRYVVDSGLARVKRYRYRSRVEQLQIEPVSQAAANQRAGRCGRVSDGVCIRLYGQDDFEGRPRFTDPEILRSSLASVILRMKSLGLPDIDAFPFLDPPPRRAIVDGQALLHELDALDERHELTGIGRKLARLPLDPRIARMLLAAHETGCLREVCVIAAALSTQDPRERPADAQQAADQQHRRFACEHSDFLSLIKLWDYWRAALEHRGEAGESQRRLAQRLQREFLSPRKLREWADVHGQLRDAMAQERWQENAEPAKEERIHQAVLTGLLGSLGNKAPEDAQYSGTHAIRFSIHPSSSVARKPPRWLMAAEIVDTGRTFARTVARIDPLWVERAAAHLVSHSWSEPAWSRKSGQIMAFERGVLYGLVLYSQRRVPYAARDPRLARELLIRQGLVDGDLCDEAEERSLPFVAHNRRLMEEIERVEHKIRRPDLLVDPGFLHDWFDARIPADVIDRASLRQWYAGARRDAPRLLMLSREELMRKSSQGVDNQAFPRRIDMRGIPFDLDYHFEPGAADDGVTMTVPLYALSQIDPVRCEWLVPGMLADKAAALAKSLPPRLRHRLAPIADYARDFAGRAKDSFGERPLVDALTEDVQRTIGLRPVPTDFRIDQVPTHLFMNFRLIDRHGAYLGASRHLARLRAEHGEQAQGAFQHVLREVLQRRRGEEGAAGDAPQAETDGKTDTGRRSQTPDGEEQAPPAAKPSATGPSAKTRRVAGTDEGAGGGTDKADAASLMAGTRAQRWVFGDLPEVMELPVPGAAQGHTLIGYPALVDEVDAVSLQVFDEPEDAARAHRAGVRRLLMIALKEPLQFFMKQIPDATRLSIAYADFGDAAAMKASLAEAVIDRIGLQAPLPADPTAFQARLEQARPRVNLIGQELARTLAAVLQEYGVVKRKLGQLKSHPRALADVEQQLRDLLPRSPLTAIAHDRLAHLVRYLKAIALRIDKLRADPARDDRLLGELQPLLNAYRRVVANRRGEVDARLEEFGWSLQELRVSLFAQELKTPMPVSVKRLQRAWEQLNGS